MASAMRLLLACLLPVDVGAGAHAQKQGGVLRVTHRDNPPSASIHEEATISTVMPFISVFNNLVVFDPDSQQNRLDRIVPELATTWAWSEDDRTLTFTLRDGVKWHDGKPFTSADVKCTWDMLTGKVDGKLRKNPHKIVVVQRRGDHHERPARGRVPSDRPAAVAAGDAGRRVLAGLSVPRERRHRCAPIRSAPARSSSSSSSRTNRSGWSAIPTTGSRAGRISTASSSRIIPNRSTAILALVAGKFDMTLTGELTPELVKDVKAQVPQGDLRHAAVEHPGQPAGQPRAAAVRRRRASAGRWCWRSTARRSPTSSAAASTRSAAR